MFRQRIITLIACGTNRDQIHWKGSGRGPAV